MLCELCGSAEACCRVRTEGSVVYVCERCKCYGNVVDVVKSVKKEKKVDVVKGVGRVDEFDEEKFVGSLWYYVRVKQFDGNMAWSSPIWVDERGENNEKDV